MCKVASVPTSRRARRLEPKPALEVVEVAAVAAARANGIQAAHWLMAKHAPEKR